jgi:hypothetical protein
MKTPDGSNPRLAGFSFRELVDEIHVRAGAHGGPFLTMNTTEGVSDRGKIGLHGYGGYEIDLSAEGRGVATLELDYQFRYGGRPRRVTWLLRTGYERSDEVGRGALALESEPERVAVPTLPKARAKRLARGGSPKKGA